MLYHTGSPYYRQFLSAAGRKAKKVEVVDKKAVEPTATKADESKKAEEGS